MLKIGDAHNFRRTLTGLSLIAAPLVFLAFWVALPDLPDDPTAMLAAIAANRERTIVAALLLMLSSVLFLPAFIGLIHLLRDLGVVLGHFGGGLALLGALGHIAVATHFLVFVQMATGVADQAQMVALMNRIQGDPAGLVITPTLAGFDIGLLLLGIGLWRARRATLGGRRHRPGNCTFFHRECYQRWWTDHYFSRGSGSRYQPRRDRLDRAKDVGRRLGAPA